jgi:transmembrane sensor
MPEKQSIPDDIVEQAADWIVQLTSSDAAEREQAQSGFEAWKKQHPLHAEAAASLQQVIGRVNEVRVTTHGNPEPAHAALKAALTKESRSRRRIRKTIATLAIAFALLLPAWPLLQIYPPAYLMADLRTTAGQWETHNLPDGTRITLNSISAVNLHFDTERRMLELIKGEILIDVAQDADRPFLVETEEGSIQALGTRFVVDRREQTTILTMLESKVSVQTAKQRAEHSQESTLVQAGERIHITSRGVSPAETIDTHTVSDTWQYRHLVVQDRPLTEVLDELNRHRRGRILYDHAQLQGINMAVVLPLNDTDRALQLLVDSLPAIRVRTLTPYLVLVDLIPAPE